MRSRTLCLALAFTACGGERRESPEPPISVFAAASLARPLSVLADSFARRANVHPLVEFGGSLEQARKITELGRVPDVLMLVDDDVIAALVPTYLDWYVRFATNRVVIAYTRNSRHADSVTAENWWRVLARPGVRVGRADSLTAPAGRHALAMLRRADTYYGRPGITEAILARSDVRNIRPSATELAALLEAGEVDYIIDYESVARQYGLPFVALPNDLASGILYGLAVPRQATQAKAATRFAAFVLSEPGKRILREAHIDLLPVPVAIGGNIPPEIAELVRTVAAAR